MDIVRGPNRQGGNAAKLTRLAALLGAVLFAAAAGNDMPEFEQMDQDGDGRLTRQEFEQHEGLSMKVAKEADFGDWSEGDSLSKFKYESQMEAGGRQGQGSG